MISEPVSSEITPESEDDPAPVQTKGKRGVSTRLSKKGETEYRESDNGMLVANGVAKTVIACLTAFPPHSPKLSQLLDAIQRFIQGLTPMSALNMRGAWDLRDKETSELWKAIEKEEECDAVRRFLKYFLCLSLALREYQYVFHST